MITKRPLTICDQVWTSEGGTPWTVIEVSSRDVTIAKPAERRQVSANSLRLVTAPKEDEPPLGLPSLILKKYTTFLQHYPDRISVLDLHPTHQEQVRAELLVAPKYPKPEQKISTGCEVRFTIGQQEGLAGVVLGYDPRTDAYIIHSESVGYLAIVKADNVQPQDNLEDF